MTTLSFSLILAGVLLNAAAQLLLKAGTNAVGHFEFHADNVVPVGIRLASEPHILTGMLCYAMSLVVWLMALSRVPVSIAYPMLSIGYVVNAVVAYLWLGEPVTPLRMLGIGIIVLGVCIVARS
jgi:multidrug transporter EmrE-like cation transporter